MPIPLLSLVPVVVRFMVQRQVWIVITKGAPRIPVLGRLIPIGAAGTMTQAEAERALARKPQQKIRRRRRFNDKSHVITLEILAKILEDECGDGALIMNSASTGVQKLLTTFAGISEIDSKWDVSAGGLIANRIMESARDKVLKQTAERKRVTYRYSKRKI